MVLAILIISLMLGIISIIVSKLFVKTKHSKQNKHNNTWFSTPKKERNPGHANHVFKKNTGAS